MNRRQYFYVALGAISTALLVSPAEALAKLPIRPNACICGLLMLREGIDDDWVPLDVTTRTPEQLEEIMEKLGHPAH